jgi:hypothetical protein
MHDGRADGRIVIHNQRIRSVVTMGIYHCNKKAPRR